MSIKQPTRGIADNVYDHIKRQLFECRFVSGDWIPAEEISAELQVSRQPVMDAMKRLSFEGFITIVPQVGCKVREYSTDEILDFYKLFAFAEAMVTGLAAERATLEDIIRIRVISEQIGMLLDRKGPKAEIDSTYRQLNRMLHLEIRTMARSPSVTDIVDNLSERSNYFIAISGRPFLSDRLRKAHAEHQLIVEAIGKRDPRAASEAMRVHILATSDRLKEFMNKPKPSPRGGAKAVTAA